MQTQLEPVAGFTADLYRRVAAGTGRNVVLSPYSVAVALGMALAGARGRTADQLAHALGVGDAAAMATLVRTTRDSLRAAADRGRHGTDDDTLRIDLADALWLQQGAGIAKDFRAELERAYAAEPHTVDFGSDPDAAAAMINAWVAGQTRDKITELIDGSMLGELTRLLLVDAAYFRGRWAQPFTGPTRPAAFHAAGGDIEVPMMRHQFSSCRTRQADGWQAASLDFVGGTMAMVLVLPDRDADLDAVETTLDAHALGEWTTGGQTEPLLLGLPRWSFRTHAALDDQLRGLGIRDAFDERAADFTGITTDEELFISTVVHEAFVSVDEQGAEAAAATGVAVTARAALVRRPRELIFDRPFLFMIYETTSGLPLFIGRVSDPRVQ